MHPKSLLTLVLSVLGLTAINAQIYTMSFQGQDTTELCTGTLYDNGGSAGNYQSYSNDYFYINSPSGSLSFTFSYFYTYSSSDRIRIYDGLGTSGTLLLDAYGSTLPNGGNPIIAPSGKATVYFYSNCCSETNGFVLSWLGSNTSAPNAQFNVSNLNPPLNIATSFVNTSTGGGTYWWDFGDGTSSTEISPVHSYSVPGSYAVKLVSTNCQASDTSTIQTVNVLNGPEYKVTPDSIYSAVNCGGNWNSSFTISDTAGGVMHYSLAGGPKGYDPVIFSESFESGFGAFSISSGANTQFTPSTIQGGAAAGNSYLNLVGYTGYFEGLNTSFASAHPNRISYRIKPTNNTYQGYHGIGDDLGLAGEARMYYAYVRYGYLYVYQGGFYNTYLVNNDQWNHIELRNIDWANKTYDLYINNNLAYTSAAFADLMTSEVNSIRLFSNGTAATGFDNIQVLNEEPVPFTFTPGSGILSVGNSQTINISGNTTDLVAGIYEYQIKVSSNAAGADSTFIIPVTVEVTGTPIMNLAQNCINHGSIFAVQTDTASLMIFNTGCAALDIDSLRVTNGDFILDQQSMSIPAFDTAYVQCVFNPAGNIGTYDDTIYFYHDGASDAVCLNAVSTAVPVVATDSSIYHVSSIGCNDSIPFSFKIYNQGGGNLNWSLNGGSGIFDDFENGFNSSIWQSQGNNNITSSCLVYSGSYGLSMDGSGSRIAETNYLTVNSGDSVKFWAFPGTSGSNTGCENPDGNEDVFVEYSTNGFSWSYLGTVYNYNTTAQFYSFAIPVSGQVKIRLIQTSHSGSGFDNYIIDDFAIVGGGTLAGGFNPVTGNINGGDSVLVSGKIDVSGLTTGSYTRTLTVQSNDPSTPSLQITVNIDVTGTPVMVTPASCINFGSVVMGNSVTDSAFIYNDGCENLTLTGTQSTNSDFSATTSGTVLQPGDSVWVYVTFSPSVIGSYTDTIYVNSADTIGAICLNASGLGAPAIAMDTSLISVTINSCDDSVVVQRMVYNTGLGDLTFKVTGNDGEIGLQEVLDTFKSAHSSLVGLINNPYYFYDGITGFSISDGGGDMYDGGNYITTDLQTGNLLYSNDLIVSSPFFGTNGQYFTYKGTGMWIMAADMNGVNSMNIWGNLGADGSGSVDATVLNTTINGIGYSGFVKRVYSAGDPSVNHLVIVRSKPGQSHTWSTNTDNDDHTVSGLSSNNRIYYLLYAASGGGYIDNPTTLSIMNQFLQMTEGSSLADWVRVQPDSAMVPVGDSTLVDIWISSKGLASGTYQTRVGFNNNDPAGEGYGIPVQLTVNGQPELQAVNYTPCISFTNIQQGATASDSVLIYNAGCDTLRITSATGSHSEFGILNLPLNIAPGDSLPVIVGFTPVNVGSLADTLLLQNNDTAFAICISGSSVGAPVVDLPVDTVKVDLNKCNIIKYQTFKVGNTGLGAMNYDLQIGSYNAVSQISYNQPDAVTQHFFNSVPSSDTLKLRIILHGDYETFSERTYLIIDGNYFYGWLPDNNKFYVNDTIDLLFTGTLVQNWTSDGTVDISLDNNFDVDGGAGSFHRVEVEFTGTVNWVSVVGSTSGTVAPGATANKSLLFNAVSLPVGTYQTTMRVITNSPSDPVIQVPIILNVISEPEITLSDTCINYPLTLLGDTAYHDLWVYNPGCQVLNLSSIISTNPAFKVTPASGSVAIGDSIKLTVSFIPTTVSNYSASLIINNNDTTRLVCLNGMTGALPIADFIYSIEKPCIGEVHFVDQSQYSPTSYLWDFGDGNFSSQTGGTVIHTYAKPGSYVARLRVSNNVGFDTITRVITVSPFYVNFDSSDDTVYVNQPVNFYDSSYAAVSWNWTFGDGSASIDQNPTHTYTQLGNYQVTLYATDAAGCQNNVKKTIYVISGVGQKEFSGLTHFELYPNPTEGVFTVELSGNEPEVSLSLVDLSGRIILSRTELNARSGKISIDPGVLPAGVYQVVLSNGEGRVIGRRSLIIK